MKKIKLDFLFLITGMFIATYLFIENSRRDFNIGDTYFVIEAKTLSFFILSFYLLLSIICFSLRKFFNFIIGVLSLFLISIPIIYYIFSSVVVNDNYLIGNITVYSDEFKWENVYLPNTIIAFFMLGILLFIINVIIAILKLMKNFFN